MRLPPPRQETLAVDVVVDKLLKANVPEAEIVKAINTIFTTSSKITPAYISARLEKIAQYQQQLGKLLRLPKVEQRSQEWHDLRKGIITASEFAQALGKAKFGTQKEFYKKKCGYDQLPFNPAEPPLKWGTMYEDVAVDIYKSRFGYEVHEFGLLAHPTIKHFGASPDGINDFGIMVEIKCPYRRKINFECPLQYYHQIQGQLSVCDLQECDYVECELDEYGEIEAWLESGFEEKGIVIETPTEDPLNPWSYEYSPVWHSHESSDTVREKANAFLLHYANRENITVRFWVLRVFNCLRIYRDDEFINDKFIELEPIWSKIEEYRGDYDKYKTEVTPARGRAAAAAKQASSESLTPAPSSSSLSKSMGNQGKISGYAFLEDDE